MSEKLPVTEELDFHYLLSLMPPLHNESEFAWLPELFSIIGYDKLLELCKYCGNETIKIPTIKQLSEDIEALQYFYDIHIAKRKSESEVPLRVFQLYKKIREIYNAELD